MKDHETPRGDCLNCGKELNAAFGTDTDDAPSLGDVSICLYCGNVMEFGADLTRVEATAETLLAIAGDSDFIAALTAAKAYQDGAGK